MASKAGMYVWSGFKVEYAVGDCWKFAPSVHRGHVSRSRDGTDHTPNVMQFTQCRPMCILHNHILGPFAESQHTTFFLSRIPVQTSIMATAPQQSTLRSLRNWGGTSLFYSSTLYHILTHVFNPYTNPFT